MHIVIVHVHVKEESISDFIALTLENARNSIREAGIVRFDFLQMADDPAKFVLYEVYRTPDDQLKHRETNHYQKWKAAVEEMMAEPRLGVKYKNLFPENME
ncbi:MAG: antibiotic biosynthesis monooxygenase [Anaerolineae bacterium]|nr:antibiotic biosynthesis monooxygenase [Anaerolineae bacterium]